MPTQTPLCPDTGSRNDQRTAEHLSAPCQLPGVSRICRCAAVRNCEEGDCVPWA